MGCAGDPEPRAGLERLLLEGGGGSNGPFYGGLIDEISLRSAQPSMARRARRASSTPATGSRHRSAIRSMTLASCEVLEGGAFGSAIGCKPLMRGAARTAGKGGLLRLIRHSGRHAIKRTQFVAIGIAR